jgi:energy-coupling factor transport system ATP-binding protein
VNARDEEPRPASRSPFLASLNPSFRLFGGFLASLPMMISLDWVSATTALCLELVALMAIGFTPWRIVRSTWPIFIGAPGSAMAVLLYGKSGGAGVVAVGHDQHHPTASAELAVATGIRILAVGIPAIIAVLGIDATDLADSFSQNLRLSDRFVYGGLAGMRLFSVLRDDWAALSASRRSRGLGRRKQNQGLLSAGFRVAGAFDSTFHDARHRDAGPWIRRRLGRAATPAPHRCMAATTCFSSLASLCRLSR